MARRLDQSLSGDESCDLPVQERLLDNGLKALVLPRHGSPVVVSDLYYPVGSFDEPPGLSGLAHFVEHMLFKGTERFPKGQIDRLVSASAGQCNAETGEDSTHYWFAFPADRWELALTIEADRMRGVRFDAREVELERRVIGEERSRELNSPQGRLDQNHLAVSYLRHPYRNPILGWPDDAERIAVEDLTNFYREHYRPDGAVLVVVGDVHPERTLDQISRSFERIPAGSGPRRTTEIVEPRQSGRRDFTIVEIDGVARGVFGWRTVPRGHVDTAAVDVLADLLCCGRRSRLWQTLVEADGVATWVEASHSASQRAGQFFIQLEADPDANPSGLEERIRRELLSLAESGPTPDELSRSCHRLEAAWRWEQEELTSLAAGLGNSALWGDWREWPAEHQAAMAVGADEVRRAAAKYLIEDGLTVGWSLPRTDADPAESVTSELPLIPVEGPADRPGPGPMAARPADRPVSTPSLPISVPTGIARLTDYRPRRIVLENGLRLVYERRPGTGVIALELYVDAGSIREAKPGLAALSGRLLEEGTASHNAEELAQTIEDVGGSLEVSSTGGSIRVRAEDLAIAMELLADVTRRPAFPLEAVNRVSRRIGAELRGDLDDPAFRADLSFRGLIYGAHPMGRDPRGGIRELARLTRQDVLEHHGRHYAPDRTILIAVGDFDPRRLIRLVKARFGDWPSSGRMLMPFPPVPRRGRPRVRRIQYPGDQVHILLGHLGVTRHHPDYDALVVLDHILGSGPGFSDRLGRILRDELGLVYAIGGGMTDSADILPGLLRVYAATMPDGAERVVATVTEQVRAMRSGAFGDDEVDRARQYLAGAWVFDFQTVEQRAERLLELERWGLSLDEPKDWPERIAAVTTAQVRKAARSHLHPEALSRVELGPVRRRGQRSRAECA
ncbi:MAG: M16 family metallopeptidase [Isosphaeraceae bacterium]